MLTLIRHHFPIEPMSNRYQLHCLCRGLLLLTQTNCDLLHPWFSVKYNGSYLAMYVVYLKRRWTGPRMINYIPSFMLVRLLMHAQQRVNSDCCGKYVGEFFRNPFIKINRCLWWAVDNIATSVLVYSVLWMGQLHPAIVHFGPYNSTRDYIFWVNALLKWSWSVIANHTGCSHLSWCAAVWYVCHTFTNIWLMWLFSICNNHNGVKAASRYPEFLKCKFAVVFVFENMSGDVLRKNRRLLAHWD